MRLFSCYRKQQIFNFGQDKMVENRLNRRVKALPEVDGYCN